MSAKDNATKVKKAIFFLLHVLLQSTRYNSNIRSSVVRTLVYSSFYSFSIKGDTYSYLSIGLCTTILRILILKLNNTTTPATTASATTTPATTTKLKTTSTTTSWKQKKAKQKHQYLSKYTQPVNFFLKTIEDILFPGAVFKSTYKISYHHHLHHQHHHYEKCAIKKQVNI